MTTDPRPGGPQAADDSSAAASSSLWRRRGPAGAGMASSRPMPPNRPSADDEQEAEHRRLAIVEAQANLLVRQTRSGTIAAGVTAVSIALALGQGGTLRTSLAWWAVAVVLAFLGRDAAVRWIRRTTNEAQRILEFTGWISASLALIVVLPAPLLFPEMTPTQRGVFFGVSMSWLAVAALVNGIHPQTYRVYLAICLSGLVIGWFRTGDWWLAGWLSVMIAAGGFVLAHFSQRLSGVLIESISIREENTRLVHQLEQALEDTESAQRARSRFLAAASHDLLQPVHALLLLTGLIRRVPEHKRDEVAQRIEVTAEAVDAMFRGLLDLARIDAGTLQAQRVTVPLTMLCEGVRAAYEARCAELGLSLTTACFGGLNVWGDATLLDRVVRNLVDNAVKFTRQGGVRLTCTTQGPHAVLTVSDTGEGIDGEDLPQICAPFFRGRGAREGGVEGLGLGLAITAHMVHLMQGTISIDSQKGRGTSVRVQLPLAPSSSVAQHTDVPVFRELRYHRIVVIEDDRLASEATQLWLGEHEADVVAASTVDAALAACRERGWAPPDFILADFLLADDTDGLQGIALLREQLGWCPAALVSGENLAPALLPGDVSFLSKPLRTEKLEALLTRAD